jgi:hypothetical protein
MRARLAQLAEFRQRLSQLSPPPRQIPGFQPGPALVTMLSRTLWELDRDTYVVLRRRARWLRAWRWLRRTI